MELAPGDMSVDENAVNVSSDTSLLDKDSAGSTPPNFVNLRIRFASPLDQSNHGEEKVDDKDSDTNEFEAFQRSMFERLDNWCEKQTDKFSKVLSDFQALNESVKYMSEKFESIREQAVSTQQHVAQLDKKMEIVETHTSNIAALEAKIESLEQQGRLNNIEISNVPERRGENLITLVEDLGTSIKHTITRADIAAIHRVPHANSASAHPKNIVVKFHSRITRDNVLAAFRLARGVTTDKLNINGEPRKVYLNEHLTLNNKKLFREARELAKRNNHRYVWVKHGTVLTRENDTSRVIAIRSFNDLSKIQPKPA
ncbi:hypothetical protein NE865_13830 [Phthorimaea operculella]|nr:hypothetical protein NE865_13830 [Phthorimaea operculella]